MPWSYAVLAALSGSCPPPEGRLPTCYSPVRHSTGSRRSFRVRLACVKPAANVRSEPGSNSPVENCERLVPTMTDSYRAAHLPCERLAARQRNPTSSRLCPYWLYPMRPIGWTDRTFRFKLPKKSVSKPSDRPQLLGPAHQCDAESSDSVFKDRQVPADRRGRLDRHARVRGLRLPAGPTDFPLSQSAALV